MSIKSIAERSRSAVCKGQQGRPNLVRLSINFRDFQAENFFSRIDDKFWKIAIHSLRESPFGESLLQTSYV